MGSATANSLDLRHEHMAREHHVEFELDLPRTSSLGGLNGKFRINGSHSGVRRLWGRSGIAMSGAVYHAAVGHFACDAS
jgi:hypothetical protein